MYKKTGGTLKIVTISLLIALASFKMYAGGFQINEHGAKAMGMGGAFTAIANDPSALYFNGAGMMQFYGTQIMFGTALISPFSSFRGVAPKIDEYKTANQVFYPSHFFATHRLNEDWSVGLGFSSPFGLGTKWDENWPGRYLALETSVQVFAIPVVVAYKPLDNLFVSASFVYSFANVKITRKNPQTPFEGDAFVSLEGKDNSAFGYHLSAMYKPLKELTIGASFHSQIEYNFEGTAKSTGAEQLAARLPGGDIKADLTTPMNLAVGVAYDFMPNLKVALDFQYIGWSSYDTLAVEFVQSGVRSASTRLYDDTYIVRLGAEYGITEDLNVLGGIYFDNSPVANERINPSLPETDRIGMSIGLDYKLTKSLGLDASYLFIRGNQLTVDNSSEYYAGTSPFNGTWNAGAHVFSLSLSYSF